MEDIVIPSHRDAHRATRLAAGYAAHLEEREELSWQDMSDLGLDEGEINRFIDYMAAGNHIEYDLGASAVLTAAEKFGDNIYSEVLRGDHSNLTQTVSRF